MNNIQLTWGVDYFGNPSLQINILGTDSGLASDPNVQATQQAQIQAAIQAILGQ
jgi:hypothetical protein